MLNDEIEKKSHNFFFKKKTKPNNEIEQKNQST
jgi:hypothetical protein